jgi:hypothetical protein
MLATDFLSAFKSGISVNMGDDCVFSTDGSTGGANGGGGCDDGVTSAICEIVGSAHEASSGRTRVHARTVDN